MAANAAQRPPQRVHGIAADLAAALDPVRFATTIGITPDPWQADVLRSPSNRLLLNCSRQSGKSTTTAILGLHEALFRPDSLILLLSPSLRQSSELFRTVARCYGATGATVPSTAETALRLELTNGSRIISLPASEATVRGFAGVRTLIIDEAARVDDDLFHAVVPMLATTAGRIVGLSTPFGKRGWWADAWLKGGDRWERYDVPASRCPRISPAFLAEQREAMGAFWFQQEFECRFLDGVTSAFSSDDIDRAFRPGVEQWDI